MVSQFIYSHYSTLINIVALANTQLPYKILHPNPPKAARFFQAKGIFSPH